MCWIPFDYSVCKLVLSLIYNTIVYLVCLIYHCDIVCIAFEYIHICYGYRVSNKWHLNQQQSLLLCGQTIAVLIYLTSLLSWRVRSIANMNIFELYANNDISNKPNIQLYCISMIKLTCKHYRVHLIDVLTCIICLSFILQDR